MGRVESGASPVLDAPPSPHGKGWTASTTGRRVPLPSIFPSGFPKPQTRLRSFPSGLLIRNSGIYRLDPRTVSPRSQRRLVCP